MKRRVGIRELKNRTSEIVREVRESRAEYLVTVRGEPVAVLRALTEDDAREARMKQAAAALEALDRVAARVAESWVSPRSAGELVAEQRR
ncbi:MAG: type II toxin-antitoxin system Phd/YefM family antitoxin [Gemmatimonadetes bacterium]|nr:type II toxin-antitoxin system Phd/YefM family antitoxin [Gemmatimonadota bacterium]